MKIPYKVNRVEPYRIEWYGGQANDFMRVYDTNSGEHIATFYSEKELNRFITK